MATLTLDELLKTEPVVEMQRHITKIVECFVRGFFEYTSVYRPLTQTNLAELPNPVVSDPISALRRGFYLETFTVADVAYFLNIPEELVRRNFEELGTRPKTKALGGRLNCRLASQIYQIRDEYGKERHEIAGLLKVDVKIVNEAILKRRVIEPKIIDGLRILYGIPNLDKPYKLTNIQFT
ncbi:hypothetical protein HYX08_01765 [Candidatus Woesearchaeota archaeon]|nr:hypothetical protein [Candidatus Woesearchaeota archaeon]